MTASLIFPVELLQVATSLPTVTKIALVIKLVLAISSLAAMVVAGVWVRVLQEKKLKRLFGPKTKIRRLHPFFIVDHSSIPDTDVGIAYKIYVRKTSKQFMIVFLIAAVGLAVAFFLPIGMTRP